MNKVSIECMLTKAYNGVPYDFTDSATGKHLKGVSTGARFLWNGKIIKLKMTADQVDPLLSLENQNGTLHLSLDSAKEVIVARYVDFDWEE